MLFIERSQAPVFSFVGTRTCRFGLLVLSLFMKEDRGRKNEDLLKENLELRQIISELEASGLGPDANESPLPGQGRKETSYLNSSPKNSFISAKERLSAFSL